MKICIIVGSLTGGGAERFASILASNLSNHNDIKLVTFKKNNIEYPLSKTVTRENLDISINYSGIKKFYSFIKNNNYDIFIGIDLLPNILLSSVKLWNKNIKVIISERNAPKQTKLNIVWKILRYFLYEHADRIVFQTDGAKNAYKKRIAAKGQVIFNPLRKDIPFRNNNIQKEIISVGRLNLQKNYELLLYAFRDIYKDYPNYKLRIFGQGAEEENLKKLCKKLGIESRVLFEGYKKDVNECMKNSEIFVMTSKYEGMPNALIEAMAMGFPVISSDCPSGGPRSLIQDHENGLLFENDNLGSLIFCLREVLDSPELRKKLSENSIKIREKLDENLIIKRWQELIENVVFEI